MWIRLARRNRKDRRARDCGHEAEHDLTAPRGHTSAQVLSQERQREVASPIRASDGILTDEICGSETKERSASKEKPHQEHDPNHRAPRRFGIGHGVEAGHHVRKSSKPTYISQPKRDLVERVLEIISRQ